MLVLVCGGRAWGDAGKIMARLAKLPAGTTIMEGGAKGADALARAAAKALGFEVVTVYADWAKYGRMAGPIRNRKMLDRGPALVLAFHSDLANSLGTADTVNEARRRGITVEVIT